MALLEIDNLRKDYRNLVAVRDLTLALDPGDVFAIAPAITATLPQEGPRFYARNPGNWSAGLRVVVHPADKGATAITAPVPYSMTTKLATIG